MFGLSLVKNEDIRILKEANSLYQRALEDVGWMSLNGDRKMQDGVLTGEEFRNMIRRCRLFYNTNPLAGHWVNLTTSFVFGEGISAPKSKDTKVQKAIDSFWNDPDNRGALTSFLAQQKLCSKLQYEGNIFFTLFTDDAGNVRVRTFNTDEISDIIKDPEDRLRTIFYKVQNNPRTYNFNTDSYEISTVQYIYYPDKENFNPEDYGVPISKLKNELVIYHVKINSDINDKFGVPELYRGLDWMKAHKDMAGDLATLIRSLSTIAWKKKIKGTPSQVSALKSLYHAKTNLSNVGPAAGSTQVENQNLELTPINTPTGGAAIGKDGLRQMLLMVCAGSGIFEHYYGNPESGNLATTTSMELPMVKKFLYHQQVWADIHKDLITFQLNKKIELGLLEGKAEYNDNSRRMIYTPGFDDAIDHDFPPIIKEVLKDLAGALDLAVKGRMCSEETAASIFLLAAGQNNIDAELKKIKDQELPVEITPSGEEKPKDAPAKETIKEAIQTPAKDKAIHFAKKNNYVAQRMNGYRNVLAGHFKAFQEFIISNARASGQAGEVVGNVPGLSDALAKLSKGMKSAADKYFPIAINIGKKFTQTYLKDKQVRESLFEATRKEKTLLSEKLEWNSKFIDESLIPDIEAGILNVVRQAYESEEKFLAALNEKAMGFENRIEQYVGAFWTVEEAAVIDAGKGTGLMVNFVGADDSSSCEGCQAAMDGNPYPIDEAPQPGSHECGGRCRHALQIIEGKGE